MARFKLISQRLQYAPTIWIGNHYIQRDRIRLKRFSHLNSIRAISRHDETIVIFKQETLKKLTNIVVIFHDEDCSGRNAEDANIKASVPHLVDNRLNIQIVHRR